MINPQESNPNGELNEETIENQSALQSSSEDQPRSTSDMSVSIPPQSQNSQPTLKSSGNTELEDNISAARMLQAFAAKLGKLVSWRYIELGDGTEGWALVFPAKSWHVAEDSGELAINE